MLIENINFEEITTKKGLRKNKNNLRENLLLNYQEQFNIGDFNFSQLIEELPTFVSHSSLQLTSQLLDRKLTDQQLQTILKTIVGFQNLKDVDLTSLYKQLFQQQICLSTLSDSVIYCEEDLVLIMQRLIEVYQTLIAENPSKLQNLSSWIHILIRNNKLRIPKKETSYLLYIIKKSQQYQEAIRNIKVLMNQIPQESKLSSKVTHIFF